MSESKPSQEGFPHGAKLVRSEAEGKLVLHVPKSASQPPPAAPEPSASITIIDRVLAGAPAKDVID